jgi:hypothetical protein
MFLNLFIAITFLLSLLAFLAPATIIIGLFLGVVPGLLIAMSPNLLALGLVAFVGRTLFSFLTPARRLAATGVLIALTLAALTALATTTNRPAAQHWAALLAQDHPLTGEPPSLENLAILTDGMVNPATGNLPQTQADIIKCASLCQRLLYSGTVKSVSLAAIKTFPAQTELNPAMAVLRYTIEHRPPCPPIENPAPDIEYDGERVTVSVQHPKIQQRQDAGDCLASKTDTLAASGTIIVTAALPSGAPPLTGSTYEDIAWQLVPGPFDAHRFAMYRVSRNVTQEIYRLTTVRANFLCPILSISPRSLMFPDPYSDSAPALCRWQRQSENYNEGAEQILRQELGIHINPIPPPLNPPNR